MIVLERMDHSLTRSAGRRDAEKEILDYLLPKSPAAHELRPRPVEVRMNANLIAMQRLSASLPEIKRSEVMGGVRIVKNMRAAILAEEEGR